MIGLWVDGEESPAAGRRGGKCGMRNIDRLCRTGPGEVPRRTTPIAGKTRQPASDRSGDGYRAVYAARNRYSRPMRRGREARFDLLEPHATSLLRAPDHRRRRCAPCMRYLLSGGPAASNSWLLSVISALRAHCPPSAQLRVSPLGDLLYLDDAAAWRGPGESGGAMRERPSSAKREREREAWWGEGKSYRLLAGGRGVGGGGGGRGDGGWLVPAAWLCGDPLPWCCSASWYTLRCALVS
ncbi:hypothetical protein C8R47DRAFT_393059 [Mycena vitilis]|nr:hypothetical protein C8R47DRAFT_393059 [Mycena vitilis]